jgi:hypothetical protein
VASRCAFFRLHKTTQPLRRIVLDQSVFDGGRQNGPQSRYGQADSVLRKIFRAQLQDELFRVLAHDLIQPAPAEPRHDVKAEVMLVKPSSTGFALLLDVLNPFIRILCEGSTGDPGSIDSIPPLAMRASISRLTRSAASRLPTALVLRWPW